MSSLVLTINGGSSSLRCAVFDADQPDKCIVSARVERIGSASATWEVKNGADSEVAQGILGRTEHGGALLHLLAHINRRMQVERLCGIGHRVVHGGTRYVRTSRVSDKLLAELRELQSLAPNHLPQEITLLEAALERFPQTPQVACFDTVFHSGLPRVAQLLPIPRRFEQTGIRRYGFHGLSYTWLMGQLERDFGSEAASQRIVLAHLGAGCSLAAVHRRECIDTTMAFTPAGGLVMGTRSGDLDPGVLIHLLREYGLTADALEHLVNKESGLLGLSDLSADVRDLLEREQNDERAADAINVFCYQVRKWIGGYAAVLGGLDRLVFSAGIGENSAAIRSRICGDLVFLGVHLDEGRNSGHASVISHAASPVTVHVIKTNEEALIAQETLRLLKTDENH